ncbi:MAG TPA: DUF262 domain-containing protein, partial [Polyangium sp.]|nr:DUF262 domain-containing protein [Polyangium sp.]
LGIPLPTFYFNQDQSGAMQVVDGVQRLTSIWNFIRGERLSGLIHLKPLDGRAYADIEPMLRRRFQQAAVMVHVIEPQTPDEVKLEVFKRISSGAKPLTTNEIRHCMSCSRSRELLARLTAMPSFHEATGHAFKKERRMADREFVLRFCAFRLLATLEDYRKFQSMDAFLLDFVRQVDGTARLKPRLADHMVNMLEDDFDRAMHSATAIFGDAAFRKYSEGSKRRGPLNRALFDSWAVTLADYEPARVEPHKSAIVEAARQRMAESAYNEAISGGTGNYSKVKHRFEAARQIMHEVLQ